MSVAGFGKHPTGHPHVYLTQHAVERMVERSYTMSDIDAMLGSIDPRLVVQVITVLPRDNSGVSASDKRANKVAKQLNNARKTLATCKNKKAVKRWTHTVDVLEKQAKQARRHSNLEAQRAERAEKLLLSHKRYLTACSALSDAEDCLSAAVNAKEAVKWQARTNSLNDVVQRFELS